MSLASEPWPTSKALARAASLSRWNGGFQDSQAFYHELHTPHGSFLGKEHDLSSSHGNETVMT